MLRKGCNALISSASALRFNSSQVHAASSGRP